MYHIHCWQALYNQSQRINESITLYKKNCSKHNSINVIMVNGLYVKKWLGW